VGKLSAVIAVSAFLVIVLLKVDVALVAVAAMIGGIAYAFFFGGV
jgi:ABC-type enterobactin transport system permease subunit